MKILMVNDTIEFIGGAETYFHNLSKSLNEKGCEIITLSEEPKKQKNFSYIKKQYYSKMYPDGKFKYAISRFWNIYARKKMKEIIKIEDPDIIHFHNVFSRLSPSVIFEATKHKPTVITIHDTRFDCPNFMYLDKNFNVCNRTFGFKCLLMQDVPLHIFFYQYLRNFLYRKALEKVDAIITLNEFVKNKLKLLIKNKDIFVQLLFVPYSPNILKIKRENFILFVGRIEHYKGLEYLIKAMSIVNKHFDVHLVVAGDGKERKKMENLANEINVNIKFLGKVTHNKILELYKKACIVCVPSLMDNSPLVVYEAMSCGAPIIASNVGGIRDLINNNTDGLLVKPKNSKEIAEKIMLLLHNKKLREKIGNNAQKKAKKEFNKEKHVNKILEIYSFAIEKFKRKYRKNK
ncbi:MAG: glycosyltransferase family 4 protein [Candidatus Pacearchaeota archaeon]